jgi:hypothetical protein
VKLQLRPRAHAILKPLCCERFFTFSGLLRAPHRSCVFVSVSVCMCCTVPSCVPVRVCVVEDDLTSPQAAFSRCGSMDWTPALHLAERYSFERLLE